MSAIIPVTSHLLRQMPPPLPEAGSKDARGRALVVAGCTGVPGAIILSATAALRAGAGKVQAGVCRDLAVAIGIAVPEVLVVPLPQTEDGCIAARAGDDLAERASRCDTVLIGPGMMSDAESGGLARALCRRAPKAAYVLDAGALAALAEPEPIRTLRHPAVITPHAGEMARLLDCARDQVEADPLAAARAAAARFGTVTVMKGGSTHIVAPDGRTFLYETGHVGLATAGSGDTLAGLIAGFRARGADPVEAALWGVYVHGEAGRRLAHRYGGLGFLAREILEAAPSVAGEVLA